MRVSVDTISEKKNQLYSRGDSRKLAEYLTGIDVADDIARITQSLEHPRTFFTLEGLPTVWNGTKTEFLNRCLTGNKYPVMTLHSTSLKQVENYNHLGSTYLSPDHLKRILTSGKVWSDQLATTCKRSGLFTFPLS